MKKNWRTLKWKDFDHYTKFWLVVLFCYTIAMIGMVFINALVVTVPNSVAFVGMLMGAFVLYKLYPCVPWAFDLDDANEDNETDDDETKKDDESGCGGSNGAA